MDLSLLDNHELEVFGRLIHKASGLEFEEHQPTIPDGPLAHLYLPPSIDRCHTESTVEGVITRHFHCKGYPFEIVSVGNHAYRSAALLSKQSCDLGLGSLP